MTLIPELERELERLMPVRRARRSLHVGLGFSAALLVGTTAALAAAGVLQIPVGEPTKDQFTLKPNEGIGALTPGSVRVLGVQAEDPDGGPPWGLRLAITTRKLGCLQAGRLVDGRIGVLGRDGAFDDDGKFHPISDNSIGQVSTCLQLDAKGRLIGSVAYGGLPASASNRGECLPPQFTRGVSKQRLCAPESVRILHYGLLGPEAKSNVVDGTREIPTAGEEGAYLIVDRIGDSGFGGVGTSPVPVNTPITEIRFKDGSSCAVTPAGPDKSCVNPGYAAPEQPEVDVAAPIRVRTFKKGKRWRARISFRAPVAIPDASAAYSIMLFVPSRKSPGRRVGMATQRNIKAGERVTFEFIYLGGHGRYHGEVLYQRNSGGAIAGPGRAGRRVGKVSFRVP
jgi:hypothetical protein